MPFDYFSKESKNTDMKKSSSYVSTYIFPGHIEGTGVSYARHYRTKAEIQKEIDDLKNMPLSQEEYDSRLKQLQEELEARKQIHPP